MPPHRVGEEPLFVGLTFWGSECLPRDTLPSLENIRRWAFENHLITDPDLQLLTQHSVNVLHRFFDLQDKLTVCIHLYEDSDANLRYFEYPLLPVRSLIRRGTEVQLVYWTLSPTVRTVDGVVKAYGEVRFGFWYPGTSPLELCSESTAKLVVPKFKELHDSLSSRYPTATLRDASLDITVDGEVNARFFKSGRLFDVELTQRRPPGMLPR
jgi:hypothetical protein